MYLKKTLPFCGLILAVIACAPQKETHSNETDSTNAMQADSQVVITDKQKRLLEIDERVDIIDRNIKNYDSLKSFLPWESDTAIVTEYKERLSASHNLQRKKLICESLYADEQYMSMFDIDSVTSVVRSYYYYDNKLIFLRELLNSISDEGEADQLENQYYFEDNNLTGWISETQGMEHDPIYSTAQSQFLTWQKQDVLSYYNYAKGFYGSEPLELISRNRESLQAKFINAIALKYPELDTIKSGPTEYDIHFVVEAFYNHAGKHEAALYLLELGKGANATFEGSPKFIGKHDRTTQSLQTPGDFYYYLMTLEKENNIAALTKCIRKTGYPTNISDGTEDNPYSAAKTIKRDSVNFENLGFEFDLYKVNFTFNLSIDEVFTAEGNGHFGYSGGGFYHAVSLKKEGDRIYLEGYNFSGH